MKKIYLFVLSVLMAVLVTACNNTENIAVEKTEDPITSQTEKSIIQPYLDRLNNAYAKAKELAQTQSATSENAGTAQPYSKQRYG